MLDSTRVEATVRHVVGLLAAGAYDALAQLSVDGGLSADDLRQSVEDYGCTVLAEPVHTGTPDPLDDGSGWWMDVDLRTVEEGQGDLTLSLTLWDSEGPRCQVRVDGLHVL